MKKAFTKKRIAALSCMLILLSAAGCGSKTEDTSNTTTAETEAATVSETEAATDTQTTVSETEASSDTQTEEPTTTVSYFRENTFIADYPTFTVTSESLTDGVWADDISSLRGGANKSPQLSWDPVDGASVYMIYMTDLSASNWLHWKSNGITETTLPAGWAPDSEYNGPYPPGGTHTYEIYVLALKSPVEEMKGIFDQGNQRFEEFFRANDVDANGNEGNIVGVGHISGLFSSDQ